jgi:apolipoprotein N-acyltransferase
MRLPRTDWALIAVAALLLTLAYPPFTLAVPAFVCLMPAALLILRGADDAEAWRRHLHQGFWYGLVTHGVLLYWFGAALWEYGRSTVLLYGVTAIMFGGGTAPMFAIVGRIARRSPGRIVLALPAGVVFLEWLAAQVGPIGFPWHQLALTVSAYPVFMQAADLAGGGGLAFILTTINVLLAMAWWTRGDRRAALARVEVAATVFLGLTVYGLHRLTTLELMPGATVAVVQPNVLAHEKWAPGAQDAVVERTARLAERAIADVRPEFIAWPETALPDALQSHPQWVARLAHLTSRSGATVLTGGVELGSSGGGAPRRYNAAFALRPGLGAEVPAVHHKQKLIPMIEWVPAGLVDLSTTGFGGFNPGRSVRVAIDPIGRYGTLLCYELTFADMARTLRRSGAEILVALSNDAWFGRTAAPHQHFAHARLRAVENRMTVIRAANTGVSGIVDPLGRVIARTDPFVETYVAGQIQRARAMPLAAHIGGMAGPVALGQLLLLLLLPVRLQRSIPTQVRLAPARLELPGVLPSVRRRVPRRVHQGVTAPLL